eukprot:gene20031-biopygen16860
MRIVTLAGSPGLRSRSGVILAHGQRWLVEHGASVRHFGIHDFKAEDLLHARFDSPDVQALIEAGIAEGARLVVGGAGKPSGFETGYFVKPTIFADVNNTMRIAREEVFGPVLTIIPFDTEEEAIAIANDTNYG